MKKKVFLLFAFSLFFAFLAPSFLARKSLAEDERKRIEELNQEINEYQQRLTEFRSAKKTLANQIAIMDSQIKLTNLRIQQTEESIKFLEEQIKELSLRINQLDLSLNQISVIFLDRVVATYKTGKVDPFSLFLSSNSFADFFRRYKYFRILQINDRRVLLSLEKTRTDYDQQKQAKEEKQKELEALRSQLDRQKADLVQQKKDKEHLLALTKNNEQKYQQLLSQAMSELEAIQAIIAGKGKETEVGPVSEGEKIATIISGKSACSTGTHLHFEVRKGGKVENPFSYLREISLVNDSGGDDYFFGGNWPWPLEEPIHLTQGFGSNTWWIRSGLASYKFHSGIDIIADNLSVKAVQGGTLYNGSVSCGSGHLRYVRVKHKDSDISTYYLHINYVKL